MATRRCDQPLLRSRSHMCERSPRKIEWPARMRRMTAKTRSRRGSAAANNRKTRRLGVGAFEPGGSSPKNASENPSTVLPVSPRKIDEGGKFEHRNAAEAPAMLHARVLLAAAMPMPGKNARRAATINATPAARPSEPSLETTYFISSTSLECPRELSWCCIACTRGNCRPRMTRSRLNRQSLPSSVVVNPVQGYLLERY
jgi:hypothetical protein